MPGLLAPSHILLLLLLAPLLFGPKRLAEMGRSLGQGMRDFKDALSTDSSESVQARQEQKRELLASEQPAVAREQPRFLLLRPPKHLLSRSGREGRALCIVNPVGPR